MSVQAVAEVGGVLAYVLRELGKVDQTRFESAAPARWWGTWHRARLEAGALDPERLPLLDHRRMVLALALGLEPQLIADPRRPDEPEALAWPLSAT